MRGVCEQSSGLRFAYPERIIANPERIWSLRSEICRLVPLNHVDHFLLLPSS